MAASVAISPFDDDQKEGLLKEDQELLKSSSLSLEDLSNHYNTNPVLVDAWLKDAGFSLKSRVRVFNRLKASIKETDESEWGDGSCSNSSLVGMFYYIPGVNFFVEIFFDETPPLDSIKTILELMGIMGALLFSLIVGVVVSIDYDRYNDAKERWDSGVYSNCFRDITFEGMSIGQGMIEWFVKHIYESMRASFLSFLIIILVYLLLCSTQFESKKQRDAWWRWIKWSVLLSLALVVTALANLFASLQNLLEWSVPNYDYTLVHGCNNMNGVLANDKNIWGWNVSNTVVMFGVCFIFMCIVTTLAITSKHRLAVQEKKAPLLTASK